ncbi:MAG TPA: hypothetical protein VFO98_07490 [Marmoricola sp.]|nr:hypothetical protein [Marmoricola sp.]
MSAPPGRSTESPPAGASGPPTERRTAFDTTPNAERYVLEADAMRRRQLRSALLHGSRRTWREHSRAWPAVVVGLIAVAVIVAALAVTQAFQKTEENQREQEQQQRRVPSSAPVSPGSDGVPSAGARPGPCDAGLVAA